MRNRKGDTRQLSTKARSHHHSRVRVTRDQEGSRMLQVFPQQKSWIRTYLCSLPQHRYSFLHSQRVQPKYTWSRNDVGSPRSTSFMRIIQVRFMFSVLPASLITSTYTDKHSQFRTERSQIAFPIVVLTEGVRTDSFRKERLAFMLDHDFGHLCRGRRIQMSGHSDLGIFE